MSANRGLKVILALCSLTLLTPGVLGQGNASDEAFSEEEAEGIIFERQNIMMQLHDDTDLLGDIVAGIAPIEQLGPVTASIADSARAAEQVFELQVPGGRAKEDVWTNYEDYMARMAEFTENTARMAEMGEAGNVTGVTSMLITALPCKQCHDVYREPEE